MAIKIFISYRREDSACYAGWLHDRLEAKFKPNSLFFDLYTMPVGAEFCMGSLFNLPVGHFKMIDGGVTNYFLFVLR
jgi:hypothetical protein